MRVLWLKRRDYPIQRDEYGRSLRQQAFEFFNEGYRPAQIFKNNLVKQYFFVLKHYFFALKHYFFTLKLHFYVKK